MKLRWLILLTVIEGSTNTCSVAYAQEADTLRVVRMSADSIVTFGQLAQDIGFTFCTDGNVYSRIDPTLDSIMLRDVAAHEAKHREQFARFASCAIWNAYYRTPVGRLESEAEAYAAGWCESRRLGWADLEDLERQYLRNIYGLLGGGTPIFTILQRFKHYVDGCP